VVMPNLLAVAKTPANIGRAEIDCQGRTTFVTYLCDEGHNRISSINI
jgi:hypothetical protein